MIGRRASPGRDVRLSCSGGHLVRISNQAFDLKSRVPRTLWAQHACAHTSLTKTRRASRDKKLGQFFSRFRMNPLKRAVFRAFCRL